MCYFRRGTGWPIITTHIVAVVKGSSNCMTLWLCSAQTFSLFLRFPVSEDHKKKHTQQTQKYQSRVR